MRDKRTPEELSEMSKVVVHGMRFKRANDLMFYIGMVGVHKKCTTPLQYNIYKHGRVHDSANP